MEVIRSNFRKTIPAISQAIKAAAFLAIDGEFTGLSIFPRVENSLDTPAERYYKLKEGSKDFLLIQFGLCAFTWDKEKSKYVAKPFNFYVFPRQFGRHTPDVRFLCQSSSVEFLAEQNFDFNKLFREGIPYLKPYDEQKLRDHMENKHAQNEVTSPSFTSTDANSSGSSLGSQKTPISVPSEHKEFVESTCDKIESMLKDPESKCVGLPPCNGFLRKLIYQTAKQRFQSVIHMEATTNEKKQRYIVVTKVNETEKKKLEDEKQTKETEDIENAVGFSTIVKMISQSGKLIVGHNMMLDLIHTINQFLCPLPQDLEAFKSTVQAIFPRIIDTKLMASNQPFRDLIPSTVLGDLAKHTNADPFSSASVVFDENFADYVDSDEKLHEAAYDAFLTGKSFIGLANFLGKFQDPPKETVLPGSSLLEPFVNKIFLMRLEGIPYLNLAGPDLEPSRDHVFHLTFPSDWKYSDILNLFNPVGYVFVSWISDTEAFVSLAKKENTDEVMEKLDCNGECYSLMTYAEYRSQAHSSYREPEYYEQRPQGRKRSRDESVAANNHTSGPLEKRSCSSPKSGEVEEGEILDSEVSDSPGPVRKKLKSVDKVFEESEQW